MIAENCNYQHSDILQMMQEGLNQAMQVYGYYTGASCEKLVPNNEVLIDDIRSIVKDGNDGMYVVVTNLMGTLRGRNLLIFSSNELERLKQVISDGEMVGSEEMTKAFLLEIGNIVAAASITIYANKTEARMIGDVPILFHCASNEIDRFVTNEEHEGAFTLKYWTHYSSTNSPGVWCVWLFDDHVQRLFDDKRTAV